MFERFPPGEGVRFAFLLLAVCLPTVSARASSLSYTGSLASPETDETFTFALAGAQTVTFQTWGFGGGTNAAGQIIAAGGFDPLIALFDSSGSIVTDGMGDPYADADNLANAPISFVGNCPPAGTVAIGTDKDCGDDQMQVSLATGTYTLSLSDANYIPYAVYDLGLLSEGFSDLTAGVFQTFDPNDDATITPDANFAVDIVATGSVVAVAPEPSALSLLGIGLAALAGLTRFRKQPAASKFWRSV